MQYLEPCETEEKVSLGIPASSRNIAYSYKNCCDKLVYFGHFWFLSELIFPHVKHLLASAGRQLFVNVVLYLKYWLAEPGC